MTTWISRNPQLLSVRLSTRFTFSLAPSRTRSLARSFARSLSVSRCLLESLALSTILLHMRLLAPDSQAAVDIRHQFGRIRRIAFDLEHTDELIVDKCPDCRSQRRMSSIPQSAHAASKVHLKMERGMNLDQLGSTTFMERKMNTRGNEKTSPPTFPKMNQIFIDHPLAKYNSKMMNSIWGLYNRYSVHNFKRVTEEGVKGRAGEWTTPSSFVFNNKSLQAQPNQPISAASGIGPAPALPTASAPIRDANPLNTLWIGGHTH